MPHPAMSWHTLYPTVPASAWVAEAPVSWHRTIPEKLVRCLWFDQRWRPSPLRTLDGREVVVHSPGRWNLQAGPDFQQASIAFVNGVRHRGDVEIHRYASGWTAHRHHLDARYNNVILHVFLWNDRQAPEVRRADGQLVPQVALEHFLPRPLAAYQAANLRRYLPDIPGHTRLRPLGRARLVHAPRPEGLCQPPRRLTAAVGVPHFGRRPQWSERPFGAVRVPEPRGPSPHLQ